MVRVVGTAVGVQLSCKDTSGVQFGLEDIDTIFIATDCDRFGAVDAGDFNFLGETKGVDLRSSNIFVKADGHHGTRDQTLAFANNVTTVVCNGDCLRCSQAT